jgi:rubrerythrin
MPRFRSVQDILDFAVAREIEAREFYLHLAERVSNPDLQTVLEKFAVDELRHRIHLQAVKAGEVGFTDEEAGSLDIAETVPDVQPYPDMGYTELLIVAMRKEKTAFRIYTNLASLTRREDFRNTLLALAQEEAQHKLRLEIEYDVVTF